MRKESESMSEWKQIKEEVYDYIADELNDREERREQKKRESYRIYSSEDIERVLSSNLPYEKKLEILNQEKQRATMLLSDLDIADKQFKNNRVFLRAMKNAYIELLKDLKIQIPLTLSSGIFSSICIREFSKFLENNTISDLELNQLIATFFGAVLLPMLSTISACYVGKDIYNLNKYRKEINSYERRLKK